MDTKIDMTETGSHITTIGGKRKIKVNFVTVSRLDSVVVLTPNELIPEEVLIGGFHMNMNRMQGGKNG
ncbi:hypothetical protein GE21DRAFT_1205396 [Neurospora crassa]|nr:hypothetical protein GE21DRAFT_1205396 [Neurospora crassa]